MKGSIMMFFLGFVSGMIFVGIGYVVIRWINNNVDFGF